MDNQDTKPKKESYFGNNPYEKQDQDRIAFNLSKELGPEFLTERKGPGNSKLKYVEGWKLVNLANNILDFNGWSSEIIKQTVDYVDVDQGKYSVGVSTIVRVTLKDGAFHEDVGYGSVENSRSKSMAFDKSKKESVTDGIKRALKHFGNSLGNCVYNQDYLKRMSRMPVPKTVPKSNNELYHFNDVKIEPVKLEPIKQTTSNNIVDEYDDEDDSIYLAADLECIDPKLLTDTTHQHVNRPVSTSRIQPAVEAPTNNVNTGSSKQNHVAIDLKKAPEPINNPSSSARREVIVSYTNGTHRPLTNKSSAPNSRPEITTKPTTTIQKPSTSTSNPMVNANRPSDSKVYPNPTANTGNRQLGTPFQPQSMQNTPNQIPPYITPITAKRINNFHGTFQQTPVPYNSRPIVVANSLVNNNPVDNKNKRPRVNETG